MSRPLHRYMVTWNNGHVEFIDATTVVVPYPDLSGLEERQMIRFLRHEGADVVILLAVDAEVIQSIRNISLLENEVPQ